MTEPTPPDPIRDFHPAHLADLRKSGLSDEYIREDFRPAADPEKIAKVLRWKNSSRAKLLGPCIGIVYKDGKTGSIVSGYARVKPLHPRKDKNGKPVKYESPVGAPNRAYYPPGTRGAPLDDPSVPFLHTEGEKKAAKADQEGFRCVGYVGVYGWQKKRKKGANGKPEGPRELIDDLRQIKWKGKSNYIVFDSDAVDNEKVRAAEQHLADTLSRHGAVVYIVRLPSGPNGEKVGLDDYLVAHGPEAFRRLLDSAELATPIKIVINCDEHRVNQELQPALAREAGLYQRGGFLVYCTEQEGDSAPEAVLRRVEGSLVVRAVPRSLLREWITKHVTWWRWRGNGKNAELVRAHQPDWSLSAMFDRGHWPGVRRLTAVVPHPVILPDSTMLAGTGYDTGTGILVRMPPALKVEVPDLPTPADVNAAVDVLFDVVRDFPFKTPAHRAAWLAALLTPLAWFLFDGPAPMFLIDANVRAAGKGLLADVIALILIGRRFSVMSYTNDREEMRKRITTLAFEGERLVLTDNLDGLVGNDIFDAALTADTWKDRVLGSNKVYEGPLHVVWYGTGNNVQLRADTSRRVCHVFLESPEERPETRADLTYPNLRDHVRANRGALLSAALTVIKGWLAAGRPKHNLTPWGSYEHWSGVVREMVVFAGQPDPGDTREALQSTADRDAASMAAIIAAMQKIDPHRGGLTTGGIVEYCRDTKDRYGDGSTAKDPAVQADLRSAVEEMCGKLDGKILGYKFRHFSRRNFGGVRLEITGKTGGSARWVVSPVKPVVALSDAAEGDQ